jgi:hypothetical protein
MMFFAAIGTYFIQDVVLNTFDRVLHFTSFYLIYLFIINDKRLKIFLQIFNLNQIYYTLVSLISSTISGFSNVDVSPKLEKSPSAIF